MSLDDLFVQKRQKAIGGKTLSGVKPLMSVRAPWGGNYQCLALYFSIIEFHVLHIWLCI